MKRLGSFLLAFVMLMMCSSLVLVACGKKTAPATPEGGGNTPHTITRHYITVGWYNKPATSGLTANIMENFKTALLEHLEANGATAEQLEDVVITPLTQDGNLDALTQAVLDEGNIDILLGAGNNIYGTSTKDYLKNYIVTSEDEEYVATNGLKVIKGVPMGTQTGKTIVQLTDNEVTNNVFEWLKTADAQATLATPVQDLVISDYTIKIGWWSDTSSSGLTEDIITHFEELLVEFLKSRDTALQDAGINIEFVPYDTDTPTTANNIKALPEEDRPDILMGFGAKIKTHTSGNLGAETKEQVTGLTMGAKDSRYVIRLSETNFAKVVMYWINTNGDSLFVAVA